MKKVITILGLAVVLISCDKTNSLSKEVLQKKLRVTDVEISSYQFSNTEISDKEYCTIKMNDAHKSFKKYGEENFLNQEAKYIDSLKIYKGNKKFKEVLYYKMKNTDTIKKGYLYFNDENKIISIDAIR